jgi:hypothetical protein
MNSERNSEPSDHLSATLLQNRVTRRHLLGGLGAVLLAESVPRLAHASPRIRLNRKHETPWF